MDGCDSPQLKDIIRMQDSAANLIFEKVDAYRISQRSCPVNDGRFDIVISGRVRDAPPFVLSVMSMFLIYS